MGKVIHLKRDRSFLKRRLKTCLHMSVCVACMCHSVPACMWQSEVNLLKSVLSFYYMVPGDPTWITRQAPLLICPRFFFRFICIILKCVYVYGGGGVCAYSSNYPQKPEVSDVPGVGVIVSCELPDMGTWNPSQALWKNSMCS